MSMFLFVLRCLCVGLAGFLLWECSFFCFCECFLFCMRFFCLRECRFYENGLCLRFSLLWDVFLLWECFLLLRMPFFYEDFFVWACFLCENGYCSYFLRMSPFWRECFIYENVSLFLGMFLFYDNVSFLPENVSSLRTSCVAKNVSSFFL